MMTDLEREFLHAKQSGLIPLETGWAEWKLHKAGQNILVEQVKETMASDTMRIDAPAAEQELALLKTMRVGEIRRGELIPAFQLDMEWLCTVAGETHWEFEGRFCGVLLMTVSIQATETALLLNVLVKE